MMPSLTSDLYIQTVPLRTRSQLVAFLVSGETGKSTSTVKLSPVTEALLFFFLSLDRMIGKEARLLLNQLIQIMD